VPAATGAAIVTVDVVPVVVMVEDAAVSVDRGVSVFVNVKNVTPHRYVPAAIEPPLALVENPVFVAVEND